jgi:hypothetical protein
MADNPNHLGDVTNGDSQFNEEIIKIKDITSNIFDVYQR